VGEARVLLVALLPNVDRGCGGGGGLVFREVEIDYGGQIRFCWPVLLRLVAAWWSITLPCADFCTLFLSRLFGQRRSTSQISKCKWSTKSVSILLLPFPFCTFGTKMWFATFLPAVLAHVFSLPAAHAKLTFPPSSALSFLPIIYVEQLEHLSSFKCILRDSFRRISCLQERLSTRQVVTQHRMLPTNSLQPVQLNVSLLTSIQEYRHLLGETLLSPDLRCPTM
jgi:hypothetical protein